MAKQKFYVVWEGVTPGVYTSWTDCQLQIKGYEGAKYKSFDTREEAERALATSPYAYIGKNAKKKSEKAKKIRLMRTVTLAMYPLPSLFGSISPKRSRMTSNNSGEKNKVTSAFSP